MGITGLYQELGPGPRVSLAKLSADHYISTGWRLRLAVDASIWAFQVQAGKGGNNPALRTLYYRLIRLLYLNITPLFVFDGPNRPVFKRNHKTNTTMTPTLTRSTKALLKLFGFPYHEAPGEAEAECANLQKHGVVDAVLSEDVDTLMFGCEVTFRNWSEGVPRCGIKIAADAARAGFGELLCALDVQDKEGLAAWRQRLQKELETNESGYFTRKNKNVRIPEGFPDMTVLGYYKNPIVSSKEKVERLRNSICWSGKIDFSGLRESSRWAFEWRGKLGATKFIRCLAPAVMSWNLCTPTEDVRELVSGFHGRREHFSTGECKELRISFIPGNVVKVNMDAEADDDVEVQPDEDDEFAQDGEDGARKAKDYDPYALERMWVLEVFARKGVPEMVEEYDNPKPKAKKTTTSTRKPRATKSKDKPAEDIDTMLKHLTITKPNKQQQPPPSKPLLPEPRPSSSPRYTQHGASVSLSSLTSTLSTLQILEDHDSSTNPTSSPVPETTPKRKPTSRQPLTSNPSTQNYHPPPRERETSQEQENIWTAPPRPCEIIGLSPPRGRRYSALGIYGAAISPQTISPAAGTPVQERVTVSIPSSPEVESVRMRRRADQHRGSTEKRRGRKNSAKGKAPVCILDISDSDSGDEVTSSSLSDPATENPIISNRTTKKAVLRTSLEGSWKFAEEEDAGVSPGSGGWMDVEVVDLTGA